MYESEHKYAMRTYFYVGQHCQRGGGFTTQTMTSLCYSVHKSVSYVTVLLLKKKNNQIRTQGIWQLRWEILPNRKLQVRGVVDRHKCCHGSRLLAVGVRKRHSKCSKSTRFKLNKKVYDWSKSPKIHFWQFILTVDAYQRVIFTPADMEKRYICISKTRNVHKIVYLKSNIEKRTEFLHTCAITTSPQLRSLLVESYIR